MNEYSKKPYDTDTHLKGVRGTDLRHEICICICEIGLYDVAYLTTELVDLFHSLNSCLAGTKGALDPIPTFCLTKFSAQNFAPPPAYS